MTDDRAERRVATVLSAQVANDSRLSALDNDTRSALEQVRQLVEVLAEDAGGRVVDFNSGSLLVEFRRPATALGCAVEIQRVLAQWNAKLADEARLDLEMGLHLGEVRTEGDRLFGNGISVAVRLQAIAGPGAICISDRLEEAVRGEAAVSVSL